MNIPGIDEGVKQALIKRTTFQSMHNNDNNNGVDGLRKRNPASLSGSHLSVRNEDIREKKMSTGDYLLGVPSASSQVWIFLGHPIPVKKKENFGWLFYLLSLVYTYR